MKESKYGKYVVTNPIPHSKPETIEPLPYHNHVQRRDKGFLEAWKRQGEGKFLPQDYLPECQIRCFIARQVGVPDPQPFLEAHKHTVDELIMFLATNTDGKLGAKVDIELGVEGERHTFDKTTVVYAPKGLLHGPIWYRNYEEGSVFYMITVLLQAEYN